jgi:hypothetical protein
VIYGKKQTENFDGVDMQECVVLEELATFGQVREWQKDIWGDNKGYPKALFDFIDCA